MSASDKAEIDRYYKDIVLEPKDAFYRHQFANYLEETQDTPSRSASQKARVEFIRVQLALEDLELPRDHRKALLKRESDLLKKHRTQWIEEDMSYLDAAERDGLNSNFLTFSGGFLDVLTISQVERNTIRTLHAGTTPQTLREERVFHAESHARFDSNDLFRNLFRDRQYEEDNAHVSPAELKTLVRQGMVVDGDDEDHNWGLPPLYRVLVEDKDRGNRLQCLQLLMDAGADKSLAVNTNDPAPHGNQASPLHMIARIDDDFREEAKLFVRNGANLNKKDEDGRTVKQVIEHERHADCPLMKTIREQEAQNRKSQGIAGRIPKKGSGFSASLAGGHSQE